MNLFFFRVSAPPVLIERRTSSFQKGIPFESSLRFASPLSHDVEATKRLKQQAAIRDHFKVLTRLLTTIGVYRAVQQPEVHTT